VTYSLDDLDTKKREIDWLLDALKSYDLKTWLILTYDEEEEVIKDWYNIKVLPIWKWLLEK
jgi:predicted AAA+ superfamily ATPase